MRNLKVKPKYSRHCVGTLITKKPQILMDMASCEKMLRGIIDQESVECLGIYSHEFHNKSFTMIAALAESHVSIHTWPERHVVQLDVFLCNYMRDNTEKCERIYNAIVDYFGPIEKDEAFLDRI
jgi:S-adenosylmethionine decarboxylase